MKFEDALEFTNYHFASLCTLDSSQEQVKKFLSKNKK